jgi:hypothetical protein
MWSPAMMTMTAVKTLMATRQWPTAMLPINRLCAAADRITAAIPVWGEDTRFSVFVQRDRTIEYYAIALHMCDNFEKMWRARCVCFLSRRRARSLLLCCDLLKNANPKGPPQDPSQPDRFIAAAFLL